MKLTYSEQTIDFFSFDLPETIVISLSGGADSASAMYLTAKHFPEIEIVPFCCRDINAPKDADAAELIVKWIKTEFPNNKIRDLKTVNFDDKSESIVSWEECDKAIANPRFNYKNLNRVQMSKIIQIDRIARSVMKENPGAIRLDGMTRNPPEEEMLELGFWDKAERRRDKSVPKIQELRTVKTSCEAAGVPILPAGHSDYLNNIYQVYINVDKKFVAGVYQENNLMESLFPITRSCVGTARGTDNFTRDCHQCFWCHERKWAFNLEWND
jgi:7-cyano-7-deazaguanine synthase in queuosine biosynthesis